MKGNKKMKYKIAIFDMDGTILDTLEDIADSMNYALTKHNMPARSIEQIRSFVGNGLHKLVERAVPNGTTDTCIEEVFETLIEYYKDNCANKTKPYDGIIEVIKRLREQGMLTAVVSNKADFAVQSLCEDYFKGMFDYAVGLKEGARPKPYPDSVIDILEKFNLLSQEAVYIGDSDVDYMTAVNSKMDALMVGWGFRDEKFLMENGASFVLKKPAQIEEYCK